jgi:hypothetical protein
MTEEPPAPRSDKIFHYPAVGRCIYCGEAKDQLTDEHVIPYSLGGVLILDKSSCKRCSAVTRDFETTIARTMYGPFRVKHEIQTRRPRERPTHFNIGIIDKLGRRRTIPIPAKPATPIYKFAKSKILLGLPETVDNLEWIMCMSGSRDELNNLKKQYNWDGQVRFKTTPVEFARLIAHGQRPSCDRLGLHPSYAT